MTENPYDRPLIVTIISIIYAISAAILFIAGIVFIVGGETLIDEIVKQDPSMDVLKGLGLGMGIAYLILGLVTAIVSYGFLRGWGVMWYLGVLFTVIGALFSIMTIVLGGFVMVVSLAVELIILLYLFKPNVKLYFLKHE